jgi:thymidylate synthase
MADNINELYTDVLYKLKVGGKKANSRNGAVWTLEYPQLFTLNDPTARVLFCPTRKANHYFHVMETVWMLGGGKKVDWIKDFNKGITRYAEDDGMINGAYGHRWRRHFGRDQIMGVIRELQRDRFSRQAVIAMYDPSVDYKDHWRDRPCNTHIYFRIIDLQLDMTVCNRSNDAVWGMCGANAVHMTYLQEFVARALNCQVGRYHVMTNNLHIYEPHWPLAESPDFPYKKLACDMPVFQHEQSPWEFLEECRIFNLHQADGTYKSPWLNHVVRPMYEHYMCRLNKDYDTYDTTETADTAWRLGEDLWRSWHE